MWTARLLPWVSNSLLSSRNSQSDFVHRCSRAHHIDGVPPTNRRVPVSDRASSYQADRPQGRSEEKEPSPGIGHKGHGCIHSDAWVPADTPRLSSTFLTSLPPSLPLCCNRLILVASLREEDKTEYQPLSSGSWRVKTVLAVFWGVLGGVVMT